MPLAPPSASPTAIAMVATRTVVTARAALTNQEAATAAALQKQYLLINVCAEGAPTHTGASETDSIKPNRPQSAVRPAEASDGHGRLTQTAD